MLSMASLRVKSINIGSSGLAHQSRGLPHAGESLSTDVRARDGSPPASIAADPSRRDVPARTLPPAMEGVSGMDADSSPNTTTSEDPSAMSPSVWPMPDGITWAIDGAGHASSSGTATIAPGRDTPITTAATSAYVSGVLIGYVTPSTVGAASAVGSPVRSIVSSGIAAIAGYSATSKGVP